MRIELPAASTTPATAPFRSTGMDDVLLLAQVARRARSADGQQLRQDAHGHLLRPVRTQVETNRSEEPVGPRRVYLFEYFLFSGARTEKADVRSVGPEADA